MRIVLIAPDYPPIIGGAEIFTGIVAERLARRHTVQVITRLPSLAARRLNNLGETSLPTEETRNGVSIHRTAYLELADLRMLTSIPGLLTASLRLAKRSKPDIIHTVSFYPSLAIGRLLKQFLSVPLVHTEQGLITDVLRGNINILDRYGGWLKPITRWSFALVDEVMCVSSTVADRVHQYYSRPDHIHIIPNGVDTHLFRPLENRAALRRELELPEGFIFISASRLVEKNGIDTLIQAAGKLNSLQQPVSVVIAGDGVLRPAFERAITKFQLSSTVRLVGSIPHTELPRWLAACDAFVRPSVSEGFGIAFIEAMACGLPLITTPVVAQMGIFKAGQHGLVLPTGAVDDLANCMKELVDNNPIRQRLAAEARRWAVEQYDWDSIVTKIEKIYERAVKGQ